MNEIERRALLGAAGAGALAAMASAKGRGPLDPPAGALAGTGRTLDEVYNRIPAAAPAAGAALGLTPISGGNQAVTIDQPGSYVLTGNLAAFGIAPVISIMTSDVTLDMNGYTAFSTYTNSNIALVGSLRNVRVRNGSLRTALYGISSSGTLTGCVFEDLLIQDVASAGIKLAGGGSNYCHVRRCTIANIGGGIPNDQARGISLSGSWHMIEDCRILNVRSFGNGSTPCYGVYIESGTGTLVYRCTASTQSGSLAAGAGMYINGVYRGNTVSGWATPYQLVSGVNAGENF